MTDAGPFSDGTGPPRTSELTAATRSIAIDRYSATCKPETNTDTVAALKRVVPTKMANANPRGIREEAMRMAVANDITIPTLEKVLNIPDAIPY